MTPACTTWGASTSPPYPPRSHTPRRSRGAARYALGFVAETSLGRSWSPPGFTLIEVIVALAILSVAVVAAIQGFAQGLRLLKLAGDHQYATLLADEKVREIVTLKAGREQGEDDRSGQVYAWETTTTELAAPDLTANGTQTTPWRVYEVQVKVRWGGRREVELATLRTALATDESGPSSPTTSATSRALGPTSTTIRTPAVTPPGTTPR